MTGLIAPDRWTCPDCRRTESPAVVAPAVHREIRLAQERHARAHAASRRGWISMQELLLEFMPGSHGPGWTWADEMRDLLSVPCLCASVPPDTSVECETPGHYQLMLEDRLRALGRVDQPICLGTDGRVWDGHHRVVAAMRLHFDGVPVENSNAVRG